jgi:hypothetical protein
VLALDGSTLATFSSLHDVPNSLSFPPPTNFSGSTLAWAIRDSPRVIPATHGPLPPTVYNDTIAPALVNTSGFDLRNDAADAYIFLPGAGARGVYGYAELRSEYLALTGTVRVFDRKLHSRDAIGFHACSLEASMCVTNDIPLGCPLFLPVRTVNCVQTLKDPSRRCPMQRLARGLAGTMRTISLLPWPILHGGGMTICQSISGGWIWIGE